MEQVSSQIQFISARFKHIDELRRMNAKIKVEGGSAIITGPFQLARQHK